METPETTTPAPAPTATRGPSPYLTPIAVVAGAAIIAVALMFGKPAEPKDPTAAAQAAALKQLAPITREDHIRGNPDAPVKIVEYSDTECPFCKQFHMTMKQVIDEYGPSGKVAWVYRHFPLDMLHKKARKEAEATECAAAIGGEDAFWAYIDRVMEVTSSNDSLPETELPKIAAYVGVDVTKFNECLASGRMAERIQKDAENAVATGGQGTPWSIIVNASGKMTPVGGAYPYTALKQMLDVALAGK